MKKFLLSLLFVVLPLLLTLSAGEWVVRRLPNAYKTKHAWMSQHAEQVETLILGSSHTYYGILPQALPDCAFNLANPSQNLRYDHYLLTHYAPAYERLRRVILPISYFTFFDKEYEEDKSFNYLTCYYKLYMDCPYHSDFSSYALELFYPSSYFGKLQAAMRGEAGRTDCDSLGWGTNHLLSQKQTTWETTDAIETVFRHTAKDWDAVAGNLSHLQKMIDFCEEKDIELILITTPTWHTYYERLDTAQLKKSYTIIHTLQSSHPRLRHLDFLKDKRFEADDFYDADHLSELGAAKLTKYIIQSIRF